MKAQELRLGNTLQYGDSEIIVDANIIRDFGLYISTGLKSIPLTEEWLVRFGFDSEGFKQYDFLNWGLFVKKGMGNGYTASHGFFVQRFELTEVKYVHELQNLFYALSHEELTLTND